MQINYFGYGANSDVLMVGAIIGRIPRGYWSMLPDYELCIQTWEEIPEAARDVLQKCGWGSGFRSYSIRRKAGASVWGKIWELTKKEWQLVANWEMHGIWYEPVTVRVAIEGNRAEEARTEIVDDPAIKKVVNGSNYQKFLNSRNRMFAVATRERVRLRTGKSTN